MNNGYSQSNKKASMAAKMVTKYSQNGSPKQGGSGMKTTGHGKAGSPDKMKPRMQGTAKGSLAQKPKGANSAANFSSKGLYTQAGNEC